MFKSGNTSTQSGSSHSSQSAMLVDPVTVANVEILDPEDVALQWTCALDLIDQIHGGG